MNRMTCREFDEVVHGLVRLELLDIALREEALAHAARCGNCAERMSAARVLAETTEGLADLTREQRARGSIKAELVAAFRAWRRRRLWWQVFEWSTAGAVAAMGLLLLLTWNVYLRPQAPAAPAPRKDVSSQSRQPLEATAPTGPASPGDSLPAQASSTSDASADTASASAAGAPVMNIDESGFVPVPDAAELDPQDSGMIVRVQLTPDSLAELGYPIAAVSGEDLIRADVLVGEDGWPRAVRLVQ